MKDKFRKILDVSFNFENRPGPVPGEMRPHWKMATLLLLLNYSRGKKASLRKLHVLDWIMRNSESREKYLKYVKGELLRTSIIIRIDPGLNYTLDLIRAEGLIKLVEGKTVVMTKNGEEFVKEIEKDENLLIDEKKFVFAIKSNIQESRIEELLDWRGELQC